MLQHRVHPAPVPFWFPGPDELRMGQGNEVMHIEYAIATRFLEPGKSGGPLETAMGDMHE